MSSRVSGSGHSAQIFSPSLVDYKLCLIGVAEPVILAVEHAENRKAGLPHSSVVFCDVGGFDLGGAYFVKPCRKRAEGDTNVCPMLLVRMERRELFYWR